MNLEITFGCLLFFPLFAFSQDNPNYNLQRGNQEFRQQNYEEANHFYNKSLRAKDNQFDAHYNLGNALYKQKKYEQANAEFQKASQLTKNKPELLATTYNQGNAYFQQKNYQKAIETYKKALKIDSKNPSVLKNFEIAKRKIQEQEQKESSEQNQQQKLGKNSKHTQKGDQKQPENQKSNQENGIGNRLQAGKLNTASSKTEKTKVYDKISKDLEKEIFEQLGEKEKRTTQRILNEKATSNNELNERDW